MISDENYLLYINNFIETVYQNYDKKDIIINSLKKNESKIKYFLKIDKMIRDKQLKKRIDFSFLTRLNNGYINNFLSYLIGLEYGIYNITIDTSLFLPYSDLNNINDLLLKDGYYVNENKLSEDFCNKLLNNINKKFDFTKKMVDKKQVYKNFDIFNFKQKGTFWINNHKDILSLDEVQQICTDPYILNITQKYLRTKPLLIQTNFWASYSGESDSTQVFHQDGDDIKFIKIFIYLNDVSLNNGPHSYVKGSINQRMLINQKFRLSERYDDNTIVKSFGKDNILNMVGSKGTIIFENTEGFHKGSPLKSGYRFMLQLLYCSSTLPFDNYLPIVKDLDPIKNKILFEAKQKYPDIFQFYNFTTS